MLTGDHTDGATGLSSHADWRNWLGNHSLFTPGLRESYRRTLEGFEEFCRKRGVSGSSGGGAPAAARATVGLAREYVELQRLERAPGPTQLQERKEALHWLFRCRGRPPGAMLTGVPPPWGRRTWVERRGNGGWWRRSGCGTCRGGRNRR